MRSLWSTRLEPQSLSSILFPLLLILLIPTILHAYGDSIAQEDHNHPRILNEPLVLDSRLEEGNYEPEFIGVDRSIIGRATGDDQALANNDPGQLNIEQGDDQFWTFPKQALFGPKSPDSPGLPPPLQSLINSPEPEPADERILYISLNTCLQPAPKSSDAKNPPDQLKLYVSTNSNNKRPRLGNSDYAIEVDEGFASLNFSAKDDVYFGISAPKDDDFDGVYNYQLTASIDGLYVSYINETYLNFIDSDSSSALLYTSNFTDDDASNPDFEKWLDGPNRFSIFVQNQDNPSLNGMQKSVCALQNLADVRAETVIDTSMTLAGDNSPKQQFHVRTLNASSTYNAITAVIGNSTASGNGVVGGGGIVWESSRSFKTKSSTLTSNSPEFLTNDLYA
ncbi:hypothetical protein ACLMJK_009220 [Lecanora helva]